ncbi:hypothetical protein, partial [Endozoicomonas sp. YOMI1]|uniref:hypothetical protein n=1 Tax=Endozoicomonas sp. YOMI1 TaxID=2828739 RepID=UPI0021488235
TAHLARKIRFHLANYLTTNVALVAVLIKSISTVKAHAGKVPDNLISHCLNPSKKPGPHCRVFFFYPTKHLWSSGQGGPDAGI